MSSALTDIAHDERQKEFLEIDAAMTSAYVVLIGKAGAGKDTVAEYLTVHYGFQRYAFADKLKTIARELFPEAFQGTKPRVLLQVLGERMRQIDKDVWVRYLLRRIETERPLRAVITDCRYSNELEQCFAAGFIPVMVFCPDEVRQERLAARGDRPLSPKEAAHPSENDVFALFEVWPEKRILDNSGSFKHLYEQVDTLMEVLHVMPTMSVNCRK